MQLDSFPQILSYAGAPEEKRKSKQKREGGNSRRVSASTSNTLRRDALATIVTNSGLRRPLMPKGVVKKTKNKRGRMSKK